MKKVGFLTDSGGNNSAMRLLSFLSLLFSFALAVWAAYKNTDMLHPIIYFYITAAFTGKVSQKFAEKPSPEKPGDD